MSWFSKIATAFGLSIFSLFSRHPVSPIERTEPPVLSVVSEATASAEAFETSPLPTPTVVPSPLSVPSPSPTIQPVSSPNVDTEKNTQSDKDTLPEATSQPEQTKNLLYQESLLNQINDFRRSRGVSVVHMNSEVCNFAALRAQEISQEFSHAKFQERLNNKSFPYSSFSEVTENIAMLDNESQLIGLWSNSPTHAENMLKDTPFVCVAKSGNYYAYEGLRP